MNWTMTTSQLVRQLLRPSPEHWYHRAIHVARSVAGHTTGVQVSAQVAQRPTPNFAALAVAEAHSILDIRSTA